MKHEIKSLGIICGSGNYPVNIISSCIEQNIRFCLIFLKDFASNNLNKFKTNKQCIDILPIKIGEVSKAINFLHNNNIKHLVFAGGVQRPSLKSISLDPKAAKWLLKLGKSFFSGDDVLLKTLISILKTEGFTTISGTDLLQNIFVANKFYTSKTPNINELEDIKYAFKTAKIIGSLDIGQSVIVHNGLILGVECVEGTDNLIKRCATLRKSSTGGILVKTSKPQQDKRIDLPTVGTETLNNLILNNFSGLVVEADQCIIIEKNKLIDEANKAEIFFGGYCD